MKAQLKFDLKHDQHAFECAINGVKYFDIIDDMRQHLRSLEKYQDITPEQHELVLKIREFLQCELEAQEVSQLF